MAQLSNITLPNGTTYSLKGSIYTVVGTQTESTGSWTGVLNTIDALYDGLSIAYFLPFAGNGNATLNLTLKNGTTGAVNCYYNGTTRLSTHYAAGSMILLTYYSAGSISITGETTEDNRWVAHGCYNTNTTYSAMSKTEAWTGTATSSRTMRADYLKQILANLGGTGLDLVHNATNGIVLNLSASGVTAGSYGDDTNQTPGYGNTFKVPYVTVDDYGRVTSISEHTVQIPASDNSNTDTLVSQTNSTANSDLRVLLSLSANDTTETKGSYKSTNFKANPSTGKFRATSFNVADHVTQQYNTTTESLDFIFS